MSISLGGIIAGGMAGGAGAVQDQAQLDIKHGQAVDLMKQTQQAEQEKQLAIDQARREADITARQRQSGEINARTGVIADQMQADRVNTWAGKHQADMGPNVPTDNTGDDLSPDLRSLVPLSDNDRAKARDQAGAELGYRSPDNVALTNYKQGMLENRADMLTRTLQSRESEGAATRASRESIAADRDASRSADNQARIDAELQKAGPGGAKDRLTTIVNSANATITNLTNSDRPKTPEGKTAWQRQLDDAISLRDLAMGQLKGNLKGSPAGGATPTGTGNVGPSVSTAPSGVADAAAAARAKFFGQ